MNEADLAAVHAAIRHVKEEMEDVCRKLEPMIRVVGLLQTHKQRLENQLAGLERSVNWAEQPEEEEDVDF